MQLRLYFSDNVIIPESLLLFLDALLHVKNQRKQTFKFI